MGTSIRIEETENASEDQSPGRSTIKFPYLDLDDAVEIAKAVHEINGTTCQREQLAARLGVVATGGGFALRLVTARLFGLISSEKGTVSLTPLGSRVNDPQQEKAARAESFLLVPLYKAIYDNFKSTTLPPNPGLEGAMETLGVAPKQKDKARQAFQRSATQAGFFAYGNNRLVMPSFKASPEAEKPKGTDEADPERGESGAKPPPEKKKQHPFIEGLLDKLPEPNKEWPLEARKKWLQTAANIFDLMYSRNENDAGELNITLTKAG
jgi:hypothetical protein